MHQILNIPLILSQISWSFIRRLIHHPRWSRVLNWLIIGWFKIIRCPWTRISITNLWTLTTKQTSKHTSSMVNIGDLSWTTTNLLSRIRRTHSFTASNSMLILSSRLKLQESIRITSSKVVLTNLLLHTNLWPLRHIKRKLLPTLVIKRKVRFQTTQTRFRITWQRKMVL